MGHYQGGALVAPTAVSIALTEAVEGKKMAEATFAAIAILEGAAIGGILGSVGGAWIGVLEEPSMAGKDRKEREFWDRERVQQARRIAVRKAREIEDAKLWTKTRKKL